MGAGPKRGLHGLEKGARRKGAIDDHVVALERRGGRFLVGAVHGPHHDAAVLKPIHPLLEPVQLVAVADLYFFHILLFEQIDEGGHALKSRSTGQGYFHGETSLFDPVPYPSVT